MYKLFIYSVLFSVFVLFNLTTSAQEMNDYHVVHIQTFKMTDNLGNDAEAFNDMLKRQAEVVKDDDRVLRSYVLRHDWGADSRDLVFVAEFASEADLFAFYNEMNDLYEKAFSKEQLDEDNALWAKHVGQHADEIYRVLSDTRK